MNDQLVNEIADRLKRDILSNKSFMKSILKEMKLTRDNIDPELILTIMAQTASFKQPPVPKTNLKISSVDRKETVCRKPIAIGQNSVESKIVADILAGNNVYLYGKAGTGKSQPLYSKLLTPTGWTTMGEVRVGDLVFSDDGKSTKVTGVFDRGIKKVYRVYMQDGSYTDTCDEHLWKIFTDNDKTNKKDGRAIALKDIKVKRPNGRYDAYIPITKPVQFKAKKHIIDPYVLGVLIGDGCMMAEYASFTSVDKGIIEKVKSLLPDSLCLSVHESDGKTTSYCIRKKVKNYNTKSKNIVTDELKRLGLMYKKSLDKFIPDEYLYDSIENRVKLLQGLNDTDGYAGKTSIEFSTSSEKLKNDYVELVQSLGGTCTTKERMPDYRGKDGKMPSLSYRILVKLPNNINPFSLKRKQSKVAVRTKYFPYRHIEKVEFLGDMPTKCISVASKTHLYITDDYIVTHNTYLAEAIAECVLQQPVFIIPCSQWTSPIDIKGGQTITGYKEGQLVEAWAQGGILVLDELAKLDPNTAGLLNQALAETASQPRYNTDGTIIESTIPYITNGRGEKIMKGQSARNADGTYKDHAFRFGVIGTGNTDMKTIANQYSGNQKQDYSLVDRFAGSYYVVDYAPDKEMALTYPYVFTVAQAIRQYLDSKTDVIESVSLRTMLNFNRTYEQYMLYIISSPYADKIFDNEGKEVEPKSLQDSLDSFIMAMPPEKARELQSNDVYKNALQDVPSEQMFKVHFMLKYGKNPDTKEDVTVEQIDAYKVTNNIR